MSTLSGDSWTFEAANWTVRDLKDWFLAAFEALSLSWSGPAAGGGVEGPYRHPHAGATPCGLAGALRRSPRPFFTAPRAEDDEPLEPHLTLVRRPSDQARPPSPAWTWQVRLLQGLEDTTHPPPGVAFSSSDPRRHVLRRAPPAFRGDREVVLTAIARR